MPIQSIPLAAGHINGICTLGYRSEQDLPFRVTQLGYSISQRGIFFVVITCLYGTLQGRVLRLCVGLELKDELVQYSVYGEPLLGNLFNLILH